MSDPTKCCGTSKQTGKPCRNHAGYKTSHVGFGLCSFHGGNSPTGIKHAERLMAEQAVVVYGLPRDIDPHDALLEELHRTAGHVAWLQVKLAALPSDSDLKQHATTEDGGRWEKPAVWVEMYERERKHLRAIARDCVAAGVEERRVRVYEQTGQLIAQVLRGVLTDLGHQLDDPKVEKTVRGHLALVHNPAA